MDEKISLLALEHYQGRAGSIARTNSKR